MCHAVLIDEVVRYRVLGIGACLPDGMELLGLRRHHDKAARSDEVNAGLDVCGAAVLGRSGNPHDHPGESPDGLRAEQASCPDRDGGPCDVDVRVDRVAGLVMGKLVDDRDRLGALGSGTGSVGRPSDEVVAIAVERIDTWQVERGLGSMARRIGVVGACHMAVADADGIRIVTVGRVVDVPYTKARIEREGDRAVCDGAVVDVEHENLDAVDDAACHRMVRRVLYRNVLYKLIAHEIGVGVTRVRNDSSQRIGSTREVVGDDLLEGVVALVGSAISVDGASVGNTGTPLTNST